VFTIMFSVLSVGSLFGALWMARRATLGLGQTVFNATVLGVSTLAMAAAPTLGIAFPVALAMGLGMTAFITASTSNVQLASEPEKRGRVLALQSVVLIGSTPIGGPILGVVCETWGARAGLLLGGVACLLAAGFGLWVTTRTHTARAADTVAGLGQSS
jgi:MFS family permease